MTSPLFPRLLVIVSGLIVFNTTMANDTQPSLISKQGYESPYHDFRQATEILRPWTTIFTVSGDFSTPAAEANNHQASNIKPVNPEHMDATGNIIAMTADKRKIKLAHSEIKKLDMPAMTMTYSIATSVVLDGLNVGDKVRFSVAETESDYVITAIIKDQ